MVSTVSAATPVDLMATQVDSETLSFPTGAAIFSQGQPADAIYGVRRGIVEVINAAGDKLCCRPGELFSYEDIVWKDGAYRNDAIARTPVGNDRVSLSTWVAIRSTGVVVKMPVANAATPIHPYCAAWHPCRVKAACAYTRTQANPRIFGLSSAFEQIHQGQLTVARGPLCRQRLRQFRKTGRPGRPVMAPQLASQIGMNLQPTQLAPSGLPGLGRGAMAAAAAAEAGAHR